MRSCFREPTTALLDAALRLNEAVSAHLSGDKSRAASLFHLADNSEVRAWTESIMGGNSPYVLVAKVQRNSTVKSGGMRMPTAEQKRQLHERDGFNCRYCGLPVVRKEIRNRLHQAYPAAVPWGRANHLCHAALLAMWAQYDHVTPYSQGGDNALANLVVACAPCNFGKWHYSLEQLGIADPRLRPPTKSDWDGLERFK